MLVQFARPCCLIQQKTVRIHGNFFGFRQSTVIKLPRYHQSSKLPSFINWKRLQSTKTQINNSIIPNINQRTRDRFWYIARGLKILRIPALVGSVYFLGYNQGIMDYSRNPSDKMKELMNSILKEFGLTDFSTQVQITQEGEESLIWQYDTDPVSGKISYGPNSSKTLQLRNVSSVGQRIVNSAKEYVDVESRKCVRDLKSELNLPQSITSNSSALEGELSSKSIEFVRWKKARDRMGLNDPGIKWNFVLVDVDIPNAFVSEVVPHTIFVTCGLLKTFIANDDELGLILGHEVSHLIMGHVSDMNTFEYTLKTLEILLLSLDPTEGLMSFLLYSGLIATVRKFLSASHSRGNEYEADEMGCKIAAMACFDTRRASIVMKKMHLIENAKVDEDGGIVSIQIPEEDDDTRSRKRRNGLVSLLSTHPPTLDRYSNLAKLAAEKEYPAKYSHCRSLRDIFNNSLKTITKRS